MISFHSPPNRLVSTVGACSQAISPLQSRASSLLQVHRSGLNQSGLGRFSRNEPSIQPVMLTVVTCPAKPWRSRKHPVKYRPQFRRRPAGSFTPFRMTNREFMSRRAATAERRGNPSGLDKLGLDRHGVLLPSRMLTSRTGLAMTSQTDHYLKSPSIPLRVF
jgi:hypothetical protein